MRIILDVKRLPDKWYNIVPDLKFALAPPAGPSGYPLSHHDLSGIASAAIIEQELENTDREIEIPKELRSLYAEWRPTSVFRAERLEKIIDTPASIYFKSEATSPSGSHEFNTALAQAFYATKFKNEDINFVALFHIHLCFPT